MAHERTSDFRRDRARTARAVFVRCRGGFTLIEVLIVVVIMAVLAAIVIPLTFDSTKDAKDAALKHNRRVMETCIYCYERDHQGIGPTIKDGGLPQMAQHTNTKGQIGAAGPAYPYGPYWMEVPPNPFDGSRSVVSVLKPGKPPSAAVGALGGWQFDASTRSFWPNHPAYYQ